jgi:hypothetical protein
MRTAFPAAVAALLLVAGAAYAQDATPLLEGTMPTDAGETALEQYLDERDRLIVERIGRQRPLPLGGATALEMEAVVAFEPALMHERMLGIRIRITGTELSGKAAVSHLDLREVEELVRAIDIMDELVASQPDPSDVEVRHVSRDGFGVAAMRTAGVSRFAVRLHGEADADPLEIAIEHGTLKALRDQLELSRLHLFQQ